MGYRPVMKVAEMYIIGLGFLLKIFLCFYCIKSWTVYGGMESSTTVGGGCW